MTDDRLHDEISQTGSPAPHTSPCIDTMFRTEAPRLARYFRHKISGTDDPLDLVQEAFLRFLGRSRHGLPGNPAGYLHRIARNLLFERARRRKANGGARECPLPPDFEISVPPSQEREIEAAEMMDAYDNALAQLPPRTREVFLLHRRDELSYKQIAARLGIGVRTVEWHIAEALFRIRRMVDEE